MKTFYRTITVAIFATSIFSGTSFAQSSLADMQQDFALLKREVGQLRLQVECLQRDNEELSKKLRASQNSSATTDAISVRSKAVLAEAAARDEALKKEIVTNLKKDLNAMSAQTNAAIAKLAAAINARPQADLPTSFSSEYPKTGITYVVASGDTLGKIARQNNSKIKWIQDANKIADPARDLKIGDKLFIPQQ